MSNNQRGDGNTPPTQEEKDQIASRDRGRRGGIAPEPIEEKPSNVQEKPQPDEKKRYIP